MSIFSFLSGLLKLGERVEHFEFLQGREGFSPEFWREHYGIKPDEMSLGEQESRIQQIGSLGELIEMGFEIADELNLTPEQLLGLTNSRQEREKIAWYLREMRNDRK